MENENSISILEIDSVHKCLSFGFIPKKKNVLKGLSLTVRQGEVFGFLGSNGTGKTTTIKLIMGLLFPDKGSIRIFGLPNTSSSARVKIGFLPEEPNLYDYLKGHEFLNFYGMLLGMPVKLRKKRIEEVLELVSIAKDAGLQLRKYSKGMKQRIAMAQALLNDPDLLILDEPMSGLDPLGRYQMRRVIQGLKERGKTIFFSSHILADAEMLCDRVGFMRDGVLAYVENVEDLQKGKIDHYEVQLKGFNEDETASYDVLTRKAGFVSLKVEGEGEKDELLNKAFKAGAEIKAVIPHRCSLEDIFVERTRK